jgi:hypothetical protein
VAVTPNKGKSVIVGLAAIALLAARAELALAQTSPAPAAAPPTVAAPQPAPTTQQAPAPASGLPPQPPPVGQRGFLNGFGQWWDDSLAGFKAKWKAQQSQIDDFNKKSGDAAKDAATATGQAMKNAADAMVHWSKPVEVHEVCPIAGNGSADCATAAVTACKGKGFKNGQPLDVRTAEKCTASLWVSGQNPPPAECPVETVLLRVACQ